MDWCVKGFLGRPLKWVKFVVHIRGIIVFCADEGTIHLILHMIIKVAKKKTNHPKMNRTDKIVSPDFDTDIS